MVEVRAWLDAGIEHAHGLAGPYAECAMTLRMTRTPVGEQVHWATPSCIDYIVVKAGDRSEVVSAWLGACADHAYIIAKINVQARPQATNIAQWAVSDTEGPRSRHSNASGSSAATWTWPA